MSKRLQILVDDDEFTAIHRVADEHGMTMSEWARQVLRQARRSRSSGDAARKLAAIRAAGEHAFPTGDIDEMLTDIASGYTR